MKAPGTLFAQFLDSVYEGKPIKIVETGCMRDLALGSEYGDGWSTLYIARWVANHSDCEFHSADMNPDSLDIARMALEAEGLSQFCQFHQMDSIKFLKAHNYDFVFLDSCDGLQHGLHEFWEAQGGGAKLIVMDDFETKAKLAVADAIVQGWKYEQNGRYSVLRRP